MNGSKVKMPPKLKTKCQIAIHTATAVAAAAGAIPIPFSDTIPITAAQISMVVALGKAFDVDLSSSVAKSIATIGVAKVAGQTIFRNAVKLIPGFGPAIAAATAASMTEALGWLIADDFYRISQGDQPVSLLERVVELAPLFEGVRTGKR